MDSLESFQTQMSRGSSELMLVVVDLLQWGVVLQALDCFQVGQQQTVLAVGAAFATFSVLALFVDSLSSAAPSVKEYALRVVTNLFCGSSLYAWALLLSLQRPCRSSTAIAVAMVLLWASASVLGLVAGVALLLCVPARASGAPNDLEEGLEVSPSAKTGAYAPLLVAYEE